MSEVKGRGGAAARWVGQPVRRREDPRLLAGRGRYVDDVALPGMLHAAFVRSPVARGTIRGIGTDAARALDGVVAVFTAADLNEPGRPFWKTMIGPSGGPPHRLLAEDDVRFTGDIVALVVAETRYLAEDGAELVDVDIDPLPPVLDRPRRPPGAPRWYIPNSARTWPTSCPRCRAPTWTRCSRRPPT